MRTGAPPIPLQSTEEEAEQLRRLGELFRLLQAAGYRSRIERDLFHMGERMITVSAPGCRNTHFDVRCRLIDGAWRYEAIAGEVVTASAVRLLDRVNYVYSVHERSAS